jgi:hypothetical protein
VYGVTTADVALPRSKGVGGRRLQAVAFGDLAGVVSDVSPPLRAGKDELIAHARVLQAIQERATVLPMRFGVVMPDEDAVREQLLAPFEDELLAQLQALEGKVELHLRGVYDEAAVMREVVAANARVASISEAVRGKPAEATYYERIELGQEVARAVEGLAMQDTAEVLEVLEPLYVAAYANETQVERVACDIAFLIDLESLAAFDEAVDELGRRHQGRLGFSYSGPHPPYTFVQLPVQV